MSQQSFEVNSSKFEWFRIVFRADGGLVLNEQNQSHKLKKQCLLNRAYSNQPNKLIMA